MTRLFFALWLNEEVRKELDKVSSQFKNKDFQLTKISNLHITLAFLGTVFEQDQIKLIEKTNSIKSNSFSLILNTMGRWKKQGILWLAPKKVPEALKELVVQLQSIIKQQGLCIDDRPYKPHVTIARKVKQIVIPEKKVQIPWTVNSFVLVVSKLTNNGVEYKPVKEWSLNKNH